MLSVLCLSLCVISCLWNHNRLWQICQNCHSCQQAQVKTIFYYVISLSTVGEPSLSYVLFYGHALFLYRELQENLVRSHSSGNKSLHKTHYFNFIISRHPSGPDKVF